MADHDPLSDVLEIMGDLKDRVVDLETSRHQPSAKLAPEARPDQPWSPCSSREEVEFYANLTDYT